MPSNCPHRWASKRLHRAIKQAFSPTALLMIKTLQDGVLTRFQNIIQSNNRSSNLPGSTFLDLRTVRDWCVGLSPTYYKRIGRGIEN